MVQKGMKVPATASAAAPAPAKAAVTGDASVSGTVKLAPALKGAASPTDTVFVFARAAQGPRMPLAILRKQVKDLPLTFKLDDSLSMNPAMKISNFKDVVVGARISKSGNAMPQSGDLQGQSDVVSVGSGKIEILINNVTP
jgi:cytochrome c-type biogenesis protein CcmH